MPLLNFDFLSIYSYMSAHRVVGGGGGGGDAFPFSSFIRGIFLGAGGGEGGRDDTGDGVGESSRLYFSVAGTGAVATLL